METATTIVDRYLAAWNERDAAKRRALLADSLTEDATFVDPLLESVGYDALDALIAQMHAMLPGGVLQRTGDIDVHHDAVRFSWTAGLAGAEPVIGGTDIGKIGPDARFTSITAFFDFVPAGLLG